ncbi:MAG: glycosyl hydrolase family 28-related protein [Desulfuromusa sp.]|nr:glycosyl hydrolase family 28-related protein [Desulfuromusa sp.]
MLAFAIFTDKSVALAQRSVAPSHNYDFQRDCHPESSQNAQAGHQACDKFKGLVFNPEAFGANGNDDLDDSVAIQATFDCMRHKSKISAAKSAVVRFPPGRFVFDHPVSLAGITWREIHGLTIAGEGPQVTVLASRNDKGVLHLDFKQRRHTVTLQGLRFEPTKRGSGTAFEMTQISGGNQHRRSLIMRDVEFTPNPEEKNYFDVAVRLHGAWRPLIDNVMVAGPFGPRVSNEDIYAMRVCFQLEESYNPTLVNAKCWSAKTGLAVVSSKPPGKRGPEGLMVTLSNFVMVKTGILLETGSIEPGAFISHSHVNASETGILMKNRRFGIISNNLFYFGGPRRQVHTQTYKDIRLVNSELTTINDNIFHVPIRDKDYDGDRIMIELDNSRNCLLSQNMFNSPGIAVVEKGDSQGNSVNQNFFLRGVKHSERER